MTKQSVEGIAALHFVPLAMTHHPLLRGTKQSAKGIAALHCVPLAMTNRVTKTPNLYNQSLRGMKCNGMTWQSVEIIKKTARYEQSF